MANIDEVEIAAFDIETSSPTRTAKWWNSYYDIVEIAIVTFSLKDGIKEKYETFVKPFYPLRVDTEFVPHITEEVVAKAPSFPEVQGEIEKRLTGKLMLGQNLKFDMQGIQYAADKYFEENIISVEKYSEAIKSIKGDYFDTMYLFKYLYPGRRPLSLDNILNNLGIKYDKNARHRAMDDTEFTIQAFGKLIGKAKEQGAMSVEDILAVQKGKFKKEEQQGLF